MHLRALKNKRFHIGEAVLEYSGKCHPCSRMEDNFGAGGYNAVRGPDHITARIIKGGEISLGEDVRVIFIAHDSAGVVQRCHSLLYRTG